MVHKSNAADMKVGKPAKIFSFLSPEMSRLELKPSFTNTGAVVHDLLTRVLSSVLYRKLGDEVAVFRDIGQAPMPSGSSV